MLNEDLGHVLQQRREAQAVRDLIRHQLAEQRREHSLDQLARKIVGDFMEEHQERVLRSIEETANYCLQIVFGEGAYTCRLTVERGAVATSLTILLERDGLEIDPLTAAGGGVCDVLAFALRVVAVCSRPHGMRLLVLDEPFRFVSSEYRPRLVALLQHLAGAANFTILMVSHLPEMAMGSVVDSKGT